MDLLDSVRSEIALLLFATIGPKTSTCLRRVFLKELKKSGLKQQED